MRLFVTLRDSTNQVPKYTLRFKILENKLAQSWLELFSHNFFKIDHPIEKDNSLKGWITSWDSSSPRNLDFLCEKLNDSITTINSAIGPLGYQYIDLTFSKHQLRGDGYRELMNSVHHHFEILIGQTWNPSKWWQLADENTRHHIRLINNLCHEIEAAVCSIELNQKFPESSNQYIFASLMGKNFQGNYITGKARKELTLEELQSFSEYTTWGDVSIYYAQLGKRHIEAFRDKDKFIDRNNISGYRYLTGEFVISFPMVHEQDIMLPKQFFEWLDQNGFDKNDPSLALGFPRVAVLQPDQSKKEMIKIIKQLDDIYEIGLEDDSGKVIMSKVYNFVWTDLE